jgi:hypothetical protein
MLLKKCIQHLNSILKHEYEEVVCVCVCVCVCVYTGAVTLQWYMIWFWVAWCGVCVCVCVCVCVRVCVCVCVCVTERERERPKCFISWHYQLLRSCDVYGRRMKYDSEYRCNDNDRKTDVLGEKHVSVPICPA